MTQRYADTSDEAAALYRQLKSEKQVIPQRDKVAQYRREVRDGFDAYVREAVAGYEGSIETIDIDGVECRLLTPHGWSPNNGRCMLYAYGGGYVSGSTWEDQILAAPLARHAGMRVVMPEYRLSPEHPYPLPQQDVRRVYAALLQQYGAQRLIAGGESAGGNQALGLMQHARDNGLALPRCAVLFSPWCDLANRGDSHIFNDDRDPTLNGSWVDIAAKWHAAGHALDDPGLSPIYGDMSGLPPCIITTGSRDLLMSQCLRLARKMRAAGVECDLRVWEGMWHVFEFYPVPEARQSIVEIAAFIDAH